MHYLGLLLFLCVGWACQRPQSTPASATPSVTTATAFPTCVGEVPLPQGYQRVAVPAGSFGEWLRKHPLEPEATPIRFFSGEQKPYQGQYAVLKRDVGTRDLQQCADAVIRFYAEYLWETGQKKRIAFYFTSGDRFSWAQYAAGVRPVISGNRVRFVQQAQPDSSRATFRRYLDVVFTYAGTQSLPKEGHRLAGFENLLPGDFIVSPGSPGHAVLVVDVAANAKGEKILLLAQSFMPAQSPHIILNSERDDLSPWYALPEWPVRFETLEYSFVNPTLGRFPLAP